MSKKERIIGWGMYAIALLVLVSYADSLKDCLVIGLSIGVIEIVYPIISEDLDKFKKRKEK